MVWLCEELGLQGVAVGLSRTYKKLLLLLPPTHHTHSCYFSLLQFKFFHLFTTYIIKHELREREREIACYSLYAVGEMVDGQPIKPGITVINIRGTRRLCFLCCLCYYSANQWRMSFSCVPVMINNSRRFKALKKLCIHGDHITGKKAKLAKEYA